MILSASVVLYRSSLGGKKRSPILLLFFNDRMVQHIRFSLSGYLLGVALHPVLQLLGDVLVPPLRQVCNNDTWVEGTRVGPHPKLLNRFLLKVQETYIVVLIIEM